MGSAEGRPLAAQPAQPKAVLLSRIGDDVKSRDPVAYLLLKLIGKLMCYGYIVSLKV
jgi:hypothetical protein